MTDGGETGGAVGGLRAPDLGTKRIFFLGVSHDAGASTAPTAACNGASSVETERDRTRSLNDDDALDDDVLEGR